MESGRKRKRWREGGGKEIERATRQHRGGRRMKGKERQKGSGREAICLFGEGVTWVNSH
jgi:hypothetical protein